MKIVIESQILGILTMYLHTFTTRIKASDVIIYVINSVNNQLINLMFIYC